MAGTRQPLEVVQAKGRKHLTKAEIAKRQAGEIKGDGDIKQLRAPEWLPESQRDEFNRVSRALIKLMPSMVSRIDGDTIATYCVARAGWLKATEWAKDALEHGFSESAKDWGVVQDRYFKQARSCANDLGLTISSRCRLVLPECAQKPKEDNAFERLLRERERRA